MLLVTVLAIWGIIGFKIISTLNPDAPKVNKQDNTALFSPKATTTVDTFSIQLSERDPFLGTLYTKKKPEVKPKTTPKKEAIVWIPIIYHGDISKQGSKEKTCVISINGQQYLMGVGMDMDGVTLLKANNTEILVSYKGAKKTIPKI